eukprot:10171997-Alexandrium_andersonii.AAC.2
MPRVCFAQEAGGGPPDHAVQQLHLLEVLLVASEAALHLANELVVHEGLHDVEVTVVAREGEVVAVHDAADIQFRVVEAACAGSALSKPEALEDLRV